ncbi:MAG TPA: pepsin/retropepsin-like aspartic protease family protein [Terracidiphilus sp.]|nr:pepsin/retropepsin-like aspartic protease family protein [Terracidiphilus sp.]
MRFRMLLAAGGWLSFAAAFTFQAGAKDLDRPCSNLPVPFELVSNFEIVVHGDVGELTGLKFILDTGSSFSVIDRRLADRMKLRHRSGRVFNFDRNLEIEWAEVPEFRVGTMRVTDVRMMVTRLADVSEFAEHADGILGMDVLSRAQKVCIDYQRKNVFFTLDEGRASESSAAKAFVVPVTIQGTSMHFLVDTGSKYLLLYKDRLQSALPNLHTEGEPRDAAIGRLRVEQVNLPGIQISGAQALTPVLLIEEPGKAALAGVDGYLGPAALHAKRLELDFSAQTLRWQ